MHRFGLVLSGALLFCGCPGEDAGAGGSGGTGSGGIGPADDGGSSTGEAMVDETGDGTGGGDGPCVTNDDCALSPGLETCDATSGECVGCVGDGDCPNGLTCNDDRLCEGCEGDHQCLLGTTCNAGVCTPGCSADQPCPGGFACCSGACLDIATNSANCGMCGEACDDLDNASVACVDGECTLDACDAGFLDCNGIATDGCEGPGSCDCDPGTTQSCYSDDPATENVGACASGTQACKADGSGWEPCMGEVTPEDEVCANGIDDDCDGMADEVVDDDGDGWTVCGGDCCDEQGPDCLNPDLVNPGAFEVDGNMVDDDCDGVVDNPLAACDAALVSNSNIADDYAKAIDLCQFTTEMPANPEDLAWGVISAQLLLTSGAGLPNVNARAIRNGFGTNVVNQQGSRMAVFSTGTAADLADTNPSHVAFQDGDDNLLSAAFPADWYAANGNQLPNAAGCAVPSGTTARDPVMLKVRVRVPTNANSFSVKMFFYSAEYPEYVCTAFNDFFVTLVDSMDPGVPADKNIAIYSDMGNDWPVGVNLVSAAPGLFTQCANGPISQCGTASAYGGCTSTADLAGTGFDTAGSTPFSCSYAGAHGGGTGWLTMSSPVVPGETIEIRFAIWDTSDGLFDSLVLLDDFQWSVQGSDPGVAPS